MLRGEALLCAQYLATPAQASAEDLRLSVRLEADEERKMQRTLRMSSTRHLTAAAAQEQGRPSNDGPLIALAARAAHGNEGAF